MREVYVQSVIGINRMIKWRREALTHIMNFILGKPQLQRYSGGVGKSYLLNINRGLRLKKELDKLSLIRADLIQKIEKFNS